MPIRTRASTIPDPASWKSTATWWWHCHSQIRSNLIDRHRECEILASLLEAAEAGQSRALVVRGDAGVGKTALLDFVARQGSQFRTVRVAGIQSEMELAFAGLHQLCAPALDRLDRLPDRSAMRSRPRSP